MGGASSNRQVSGGDEAFAFVVPFDGGKFLFKAKPSFEVLEQENIVISSEALRSRPPAKDRNARQTLFVDPTCRPFLCCAAEPSCLVDKFYCIGIQSATRLTRLLRAVPRVAWQRARPPIACSMKKMQQT